MMMDYRSTIQGWVQERLDSGLTFEDAYRDVSASVRRELTTIGIERGLINISRRLLENARKYIESGFYGFEHDGTSYIKGSWALTVQDRELLEALGVLTFIGNGGDLEKKGIIIPNEGLYAPDKRNWFYIVDRERLQDLM